jgi:predicted RNA-binding protein (TIGR00451 family)
MHLQSTKFHIYRDSFVCVVNLYANIVSWVYMYIESYVYTCMCIVLFAGSYVPTLRTLHMFPSLLPVVQVDKGAVPFVLRGVNMMAPGLLNSQLGCPAGLQEGDLVAIMADNKERACGVGKMLMDSKTIIADKTGIAVEMLHHLGDGLWDETKEHEAQLILDGRYQEQPDAKSQDQGEDQGEEEEEA